MAPTTAIAIHERAIAGLTQRVEEFIERGYYLHEIDYTATGWAERRKALRLLPRVVASEHIIRGYLRQVARELKRPFVTVEKTRVRRYSRGASESASVWFNDAITLPRLKKCAVLRAPLILAADPRVPGYDREGMWLSGSQWRSRGAAGRRVVERWQEMVRTEPAFRAALGLPELPAEVTTEACHDDRREA